MGLTNAERQKRYREKRNELARSAVTIPDVVQAFERKDGVALTAMQRAERDAVMSEPIWPVPAFTDGENVPRFMGWSRYDWSGAPMELIDYFGMRSAREGWDAERADMKSRSDQAHENLLAYKDEIVAECGEPARKILAQGGGWISLINAYKKDPTLGVKPRVLRSPSKMKRGRMTTA